MLGPGSLSRGDTSGRPVWLKLWRESQQLPEGRPGGPCPGLGLHSCCAEQANSCQTKRTGSAANKPPQAALPYGAGLSARTLVQFGGFVESQVHEGREMLEGPSSSRPTLQEPTPLSPCGSWCSPLQVPKAPTPMRGLQSASSLSSASWGTTAVTPTPADQPAYLTRLAENQVPADSPGTLRLAQPAAGPRACRWPGPQGLPLAMGGGGHWHSSSAPAPPLSARLESWHQLPAAPPTAGLGLSPLAPAWHWPGPYVASAGLWGMNQQTEGLSFFL